MKSNVFVKPSAETNLFGICRGGKTKRQLSGRTSAASQHGPLLSYHLFNAVRYVPDDYRVKIVNDVPYAPVHNWGGET